MNKGIELNELIDSLRHDMYKEKYNHVIELHTNYITKFVY